MTRLMCTLLLLGAAASPLPAQQPTEPPDSLRMELRRLQTRLDSLERVLAALASQGRDTAQAVDELAALRAAAQAAAAAPAPPDTTGRRESRSAAASLLNPEISVTGDIVGNYLLPAGGSGNATAVPREFEFSFQSALDPYTRTKVFVAHHQDFEIAGLPEEAAHEGGFEIEEGYLYWVGLPGHLGLKVGKFRQELGLLNRWHTHALLEVDRPLATRAFLGEDGLIQTGASVTLPSVTIGPSTQTATLETALGTNEALFADGNQMSFLGRLQSYWNLGGVSYLQVGATGVYGQNDDALLDSRLLGLDFAFRWAPPRQAQYREVQVRSEWFFGRQEVDGTVQQGHGGYAQASVRLDRRWIVGARADFLDGYDDGPDLLQLVPSLTWWQSEWVRLRLQYNYVRPRGGESNHTVLLQVVWAMGPHKHETY